MAKRLFEQGGDTTPVLTNRLASGKAGTTTTNSTWQTVVTWLESVLGFLKTNEDLADLNDTTTARTNLGVYSTTQVDASQATKADKTNVLEKDNTTTFMPTSNYNPATKKYVDEGGIRIAQANASIISGDVDAGASYCRVSRTGVYVNITGQVRFDSDASENDVVFRLPVQFPLFTVEWELPCSNATTDEVNQLYTVIGTRDIAVRNTNISTVSLGSFNGNTPIL